jgi:hypothetical protein
MVGRAVLMHGRALLVQTRLGALALCFLLRDAGPTLGGLGSPRALSRDHSG